MLLLMMSLVQAQDFTNGQVPEGLNGQLFRPSLDAKNTLWVNDSLRAPSGYTFGKAMIHYANDPVVYLRDDGERMELVSGIWQLDVMAGYTRGPVRLGVQVPVYLRTNGSSGGETGLGDLGLDVKVSALDRTEKPVGLAFAGRVFVPTATVTAPLGNDGLGWEVEAIVDKELSEKWLLAANVGTRGVPTVELENLTWDDQVFVRAGAGYTIRPNDLGLSLDLASHFTYGEFSNPAARPIEGIVGGWYRLAGNWVLRGGVGTGLNSAVGSPRFRLMAGIGWEPSWGPIDTDNDGVMDDVDQCVTDPEDLDGVMDSDGCPEATRVTVLVVDADGNEVPGGTWSGAGNSGASGDVMEIFGGSAAISAKAEGFLDGAVTADVPDAESFTVSVPLTPAMIPGTLLVKAMDEAGNTVEDAVWKHRKLAPQGQAAGESLDVEPGEYVITVEAPGYGTQRAEVVVVKESVAEVVLTLKPAKVELEAERITIKDSVYFETNKAIIKSESHELLDEVAAILIAHPELTKIRIEGHTDSRGAADYNKDLSQRRAEAVQDYLVSKGVEAGRLEAVGYGEEKPLDERNNAAAWEKNRRVDFFVAERSD
ncbi:MAG: OmpA family protein [Myxococcota bacterium]|nr:OmpA family protein [Myxococcota bacterium]